VVQKFQPTVRIIQATAIEYPWHLPLLRAIKRQSLLYPNYGASIGMSTQLWWQNVLYDALIELKLIPPTAVHPAWLVQCSHELMTVFSTAKPYQCVDGIHEQLKQLRQFETTRLFVMSNCDERLETILTSLKLMEYFDFAVSSKEAGAMKPDESIFRYCQNKIDQTTPSNRQVIYIGDDCEKDINPSLAFGWKPILVSHEQPLSVVLNHLIASS
jgi:HAD superfamily hydrolase (TIGR01549 family)